MKLCQPVLTALTAPALTAVMTALGLTLKATGVWDAEEAITSWTGKDGWPGYHNIHRMKPIQAGGPPPSISHAVPWQGNSAPQPGAKSMPIFDAHTVPRPSYKECGYNNDDHNAAEACICTMTRRPCDRPMDSKTGQCLTCSACVPCSKFHHSQKARGTHTKFET